MRDLEVSMSEGSWHDGRELHLEFRYVPDLLCSFPIVPARTRDKHDASGHLTNDGRVHVLNAGIIEQLVRAGLRMHVAVNAQPPGSTHGSNTQTLKRCVPASTDRGPRRDVN
jgi:hypothetical protein